MTAQLSIALVSPHAWPAHDDLTWRIEREAVALARRGHSVSILTPATGPELLEDGRRRLRALRDGDPSAVVAGPGEVLVVPLGRALPAGPRRRIGGPLDLASVLEDALSAIPFDVVHIHEPLAPSPALAALRHARGVTAMTFHRPEQLAGVAFVQPLLERAMGRVDLWAATSDRARRAVSEMFARDCEVIPGGVDLDRFRPAPDAGDTPGLVVIARGADRAGLRFAMTVVRTLDLDAVGRVTILAPREAPWRTRASVPKALRDRFVVIPDSGPDARAEAFAAGRIALVSAPDDLVGSAPAEAMACGMAIIVPRCAEADALIAHGTEGLALAPFSRDLWTSTVSGLATDPGRRSALGAHAATRAARRGWDVVAEELEEHYSRAAQSSPVRVVPVRGRILADLRAHPGPELTARELVDACIARGLAAVAFIGDTGPDAGVEAARIARSRLLVIPGQSVRSRDGGLVGLFLRATVPNGLGLEETAEAIHGQGGLVMAPHPVWAEPPSQDLLRRHRGLIDCFETLSGPAPAGRAATGVDAARLAQRFGMLTTAGSGASAVEDLGSAHLRMRPFASPREFLDALVDAEPVQRRRGLRSRVVRERRRPTAPSN
jgi:glycosyltransferase involved in cell wall biosynthesis